MSENKFIIPLSIIIAALIIGAALFFSSGGFNFSHTSSTIGTAKAQTLTEAAVTAGAKKADFQECYNQKKYDSIIQTESNQATTLGAQGTPFSIAIGPTGKTVIINGAQTYATVKGIIDSLLSGTGEVEDAGLDVPPVTNADHIEGNQDAKVVIVEYSDLECPYCQRFHQTQQQVVQNYSPDQVAWVYRHFPLTSIHPKALPYAEAAECVAAEAGNDAFFEFINTVFSQNVSASL